MSVTTTVSPNVHHLSEQVHLLAERVSRLENRDTLISPQDIEGLLETHERVKRFTEAIFGAKASIEPSSDPETDSQYFVVHVRATGTVEQALRLDSDWHRRLPEAARDWSQWYRLSVNFV